MARSFSEDGAAGAGNSLDDAPAPGVGTDPAAPAANPTQVFGKNIQMGLSDSDPGGTKAQDFFNSRQSGDFGGSGYTPGWNGGSANGAPWASQPTELGRQDTSGITPWGRQFTQNTGSTQLQFGGFYAEGGAIPDENDDPNQMAQGPANGLMAQIAKATASVQEVLAYGRQKHGLGNSNEGAIKEADARMPSVPGNPSESGVRPPQPMPGPLPPTSNPFGKRADADQDGDSDAPGAIDTDEETA